MRAILLAAGRGSRMKGLTEDRPKCLVELDGRPLLERQLEALRASGISEIAIITGYRRDMLTDRADVEFHNPHWASTNMVSTLAEASDWLENEPCIVSYTDIFYEASAAESLIACKAQLALTYDPNWRRLWDARFGDPLLDAETFRLGSGEQLIEIGNKPQTVGEVEGQYMGLLRFTPEGWQEMQTVRAILPAQDRDQLDMTSALQRVINRGHTQIEAIPYLGEWGEVDSADDLRLYETKD